MTRGQYIILFLGGILISLRLFFPISEKFIIHNDIKILTDNSSVMPTINYAKTSFQVIGIAVLTGLLMILVRGIEKKSNSIKIFMTNFFRKIYSKVGKFLGIFLLVILAIGIVGAVGISGFRFYEALFSKTPSYFFYDYPYGVKGMISGLFSFLFIIGILASLLIWILKMIYKWITRKVQKKEL